MILQQLLTVLCVLTATLYLARLSWRTWTGQGKGCGGRCQCSDNTKSNRDSTQDRLIPVEQLTLRARGRK